MIDCALRLSFIRQKTAIIEQENSMKLLNGLSR